MKIEGILTLLKCPYCGNLVLRLKGSAGLLCNQCKKTYEIVNGIPIFLNINNLSKQEYNQKKWFENHYSKFSKEDYKLENWRLSILERIFSNVSSRKISSYLDIGCGATGYTVIEAARQNHWLSVGVDISLEAMIRAKGLAEKQKVGDKTAFVVCSAENLPFRNNVFDLVSAVSVLEHLGNDQKVVQNIHEILKKNGLFYVLVPNASKRIWPLLWPIIFYNDRKLGHKRHYSIKDLTCLMDGFLLKKYFYNAHLRKIVATMLEKTKAIDEKKWWKIEKNDINQDPTGVQLNSIFQKI